MNAFIFAPTNEFRGKFSVDTENSLPQKFKEYSTNNHCLPNDLIQCGGKICTIVSGSSGLELAEGRIVPIDQLDPRNTAFNIPISTSDKLPGFNILQSTGIVFGEVIMGANFLRDIAANFTDAFGGRSGAYESKLREGRSTAIQEMMEEAYRIGANAVIGVRVNYDTIGSGGSMMMICASGTAVTVTSANREQVMPHQSA
jgi:uncharacterized protein YbjQ (UPF0145 family)